MPVHFPLTVSLHRALENSSKRENHQSNPRFLPDVATREGFGAGKSSNKSQVPAQRRCRRGLRGRKIIKQIPGSCPTSSPERASRQENHQTNPRFLPIGVVRERFGAGNYQSNPRFLPDVVAREGFGAGKSSNKSQVPARRRCRRGLRGRKIINQILGYCPERDRTDRFSIYG